MGGGVRFDGGLGLQEVAVGVGEEVVGFGVEGEVQSAFDGLDVFEGDHVLVFLVVGFEFLEGDFVVQFEEVFDYAVGA